MMFEFERAYEAEKLVTKGTRVLGNKLLGLERW